MTSANVAAIDGVDFYDLGFELRAMPGIFSVPPQSYPAIALPFRPGIALGQSVPNVGAKRLVLQALGKFADAATADIALATLKDAIGDGLHRLTFTHQPNVSRYGVCDGFDVDSIDPLSNPGFVSQAIGFTCPDPYAVDDALTVVSAVALERVPIFVGTAATWCEVTVVGPVTAPAIVVRDRAGNVKTTISLLSASVLTGDYWRVDALTGLSEKSVSGTISSNMDDLSPSPGFPIALPTYANRALSAWPTIECTGGTMIVRYRRRWA